MTLRVVDSVVSGNVAYGIFGADQVTGSRIGTNADGTEPVANGYYGVFSSMTVGGLRPAGSRSCTGPCNLISGNSAGAVYQGLAKSTVEGNFIGTNLDGTAAIPNGEFWTTDEGRSRISFPGPAEGWIVWGHQVGGASDAISGVCDLACNLISGNASIADSLDCVDPEGKLQGNVIGLSATGTPLPNRGAGVVVWQPSASRPTLIGASDPASNRLTSSDGNVIADNAGPAIEIEFTGRSPTLRLKEACWMTSVLRRRRSKGTPSPATQPESSSRTRFLPQVPPRTSRSPEQRTAR